MAIRSRSARIRFIAKNVAESNRPKTTGNGVEVSKSIENQYKRQLKGLVKKTETDIREKIMPLIAPAKEQLTINDAAINDDSLSELEEAIDGLQRQYSELDKIYLQYADVFTGAVNVYHQAAFIEDVKSAIGVDIRGMVIDEGIDGLLRAATRQNVKLIKSIPEQLLQQVEQIIMSGIQGGEDPANINEKLVERFGITERRAAFIARDQSGKLTSALSRARQTNIGVDSYIWSTSGDERVRKSHQRKDGRKYKWSEPPAETGHAGEDYNCRCIARPDYSSLLS